MKLRVAVFTLLAAVIAAFVFSFVDKEHPDLSGEEAALARISVPLKSISGDMYLDGGSVYLQVVDAKNEEHDFAFPVSNGAVVSYPVVLSGTVHSTIAAGDPLADPVRAKKVLLELIERYRKKDEIGVIRVKYALLGTRPKWYEEIPVRLRENWWSD